MKKISKELKKSYFILIFIFFVSFLGFTTLFFNYILNTAKSSVISINNFFEPDSDEVEKWIKNPTSVERLLTSALQEVSKIPDFYVIFEHDGVTYSNNKNYPNNIDFNSLTEEIRPLKFYSFLGMSRMIEIPGESPIRLVLLKDLKNDRIIFYRTFKVGIILIILTFTLIILFSKKFYSKFNKELNNLNEVTEHINFNFIDDSVELKSEFQEFDSNIKTYKKMLIRLKRQSEAQRDFVNSASHELRTPIYVIIGYLNLIKRWGINEEKILNESLDSIKAETKNMASLIEKLLFLAMEEENTLEVESFDLSEIISDIISNMGLLYPKAVFEIEEFSVTIKSDYSLVRQLLLNLIENAIKYGDEVM